MIKLIPSIKGFMQIKRRGEQIWDLKIKEI